MRRLKWRLVMEPMRSTKTAQATVSSVRRFTPEVRMPTAVVLRSLSRSEVRLLEQVTTQPIECQFDASFQRWNAEAVLLGPMPESKRVRRRRRAQDNDDSGIDMLRPRPVTLTTEQEKHLFLRHNYCRYRAMRVLRQFRGKRLTAAATRELLRWCEHVLATRSKIVSANVPLVLAMAKRTRVVGVDYGDLISEGNVALLRSVDKFDCGRGYKFSTYACRAILKSFWGAAVRESRYRGHFPTECDPALERSDQLDRKRGGIETDCVDELKMILGRNTANLNEIEQRVIRARFALDRPAADEEKPRPRTLQQVGAMIGVTKERVRQIQNKALVKLRKVLETDALRRSARPGPSRNRRCDPCW